MALLKFKRSAVSGKVPALSDLGLGELAINTFDGKLYMRKDNGTASIIEVGAASASGVLSFNTRTGAVTLSSGDVTTALGYTPANKAGDTFTGAVNFTGGTRVAANGDVYARRDNGTTGVYYFADGGEKYLYWDGSRYLFAGAGPVDAISSFRAPIFYDSNDTGYYINPNGTSLTSIMAVGAGLAVFDLNTVASDPYGLVGITRKTDNNYSYLGFTRAGQHAMGMGIDTGNTFWIGGCSAGYNSVRTSSWLLFHSTGYVTAPVDMRSPMFYDSQNTAFYLDPASRSNLSNITVASGGTESGIRFRGDTLDFVGRYSNYVSLYNANGPEFKLFDSGYAYLGAYGENGSSWRAPIFYDSNNTSYYVDPNSTSNLYRLSSYIAAQDANANWNTGFQNTPAYSYNYHGDLNGGTNAPAAGWWFYESMRHSNASNYWGTQIAWGWEDNANRLWQRNVSGNSFGGWVEYLNTSNRTYSGNLNMTGSIISTASDVRAPIFYDQNNTARYIDPNGSSYIQGNFYVVRDGNSNDVFGGLEIRENSFQGAGTGAATEAPGINFHWSARAAARIYMDAGGNFVLGAQGNITSGRRSLYVATLDAAADARAPIFYDTNDTGYYCNPNATSRLSSIALGGSAGTYQGVFWANGDLWVDGNGRKLAFTTDGSTDNGGNVSIFAVGNDFRINNWSGSALNDNFYVFGASRDAACAGNITAYYSDERLKTKTGGIENALAKVASLEGFTYVENETARAVGYTNDRQQVGVSAQAVKAVLPEAVHLAPFDYDVAEDGTIKSKSGEDYLTVDYSRIVPLLIEAIKELTNKVETLEAHIRSK
jgi:hypothetical protein